MCSFRVLDRGMASGEARRYARASLPIGPTTRRSDAHRIDPAREGAFTF